MLVGDIILGARVRINDLPRTLPGAGNGLIASVIGTGGVSIPGTYYVVITFMNPFGETTSSNEVGPLTVLAAETISIDNVGNSFNLPANVTGVRAYWGTAPGQENQWVPVTFPLSFGIPMATGIPGVPPTRNTSYYPDSDGPKVSAFTLYSWLNKALDIATNISGGIPDMTCLNTVNGTAMYNLIGTWNKFDHGWWDGYIITLGGRDILFYRNVVPGVVATGVLQQVSNNFVIELQPQPNRSGGVTTSPGAIGINDTTITCASLASYLLPFGMALIGNPPDPSQCEAISFSSLSGNVLSGCIRGLGGTVQQAWPAGVKVAEGNLRLSGLRSFVAPSFAPGMALTTLPVPSGWSMPLEDFIVARFREAENNIQEANRLMAAFEKTIRGTLMGNKLVAGPRQVGLPGAGGLDTYPSRGLGGNIIIP